jgi:type IV pilus assembly protein PilB
MSSKLRALAFDNAPTQEVRKMAVTEGMSTLYDDGIRKVLNGITTLDEVFRVAKQMEE